MNLFCFSSNLTHTKNEHRFKVFADYEAYVKCQEKVSQLYMVSMWWVLNGLLWFIGYFLFVNSKEQSPIDQSNLGKLSGAPA